MTTVQTHHGETESVQLPAWLESVVTPRSSFQYPEEVRRARLFLVILLAGAIIAVIIGLAGASLNHPLPAFFMVSGLFLSAYLLGRFVSFRLCVAYFLLLITTNQLFLLLLMPAWYSLSMSFLTSVITQLTALLMLRVRMALYFVIINLMILLILPFIDQRATDITLYLAMMGTICVISLLVMTIGYLSESDIERAHSHTKSIQAASEHLRRLLDSSPDLMAVHANGKFLYINAAGVRMLGANHTDDIVGQEVRQFMPEGHRSVLAPQPQRLKMDNALTVSYQQTFQRTDRRLIETDVTASPIQFEAELATLLIARDRRGHDTPSQNEFPMDRLLDRLPVPIFVTHGTTLIYANHYIEALTGYTPAELKRLAWSSVISDVQTRAQDDSLVGRIQESEVRVKHKSGPIRTLILRTQIQEYRGQRLSVSIGYDPRQYTRWVDHDTWMLETAFANDPEGLVYLDMDTQNGPSIISANRVFCHTSGYPLDELRGRTLHFLLGTQGEASAAELVRQALAEGETFRGAVAYQRKDTTSARVQWTVRPIRDDRGQMLFAILHQRAQDISHETGLMPQTEDKIHILDLMAGYSFILDMTSNGALHLVWANDALRSLHRWTDDFVGMSLSWNDLVITSDSRSFSAMTFETLRAGAPHKHDVRMRSAIAGETHWVSLSIHPTVSPDDKTHLRLYCVAHDISDRIRAEEAIKIHLVQQSVVMELGLLAIAAEDFKSVVEQVVMLCEQVVQEGICIAALYQPDHQLLKTVGRGSSKLVPASIPFDIRSVTGYTAETSLPLLINDFETEDRFYEPTWLPPGRVRSALSVAIPGHLHVYGVLAVFHTQPNRFTEDDIYFVQSIANVLAAFAERDRMQVMEREQRDFLRIIADVTTLINTSTDLPDILRITQDFIAQVFTTSHNSAIGLISDEESLHFVSQRGFGDLPSYLFDKTYEIDKMPVVQWMVDHHEPLLINDMQGSPQWITPYIPQIAAYVGAPILVEDKCIGVINLGSDRINAFTLQDTERLMLFAGKIGSAIRNARHAQDLEQRIAERTAELTRQRTQLQTFLEASGEGIFYTEERQIVFANHALERLTGYTMEEMAQMSATLFYPDDMTEREKALQTSMIETISSGKVWRNMMRVRRKDGSTFHAGLTVTRVGNASDGIRRSVIIVRDMEPEHKLEEQKNRFISNAAHELRSPIGNLNTRLYLMRRAPQNMEEHLRVVERVIERINRLINDLLDLSYFEYGHVLLRKQPLIVQEILIRAIEFMQAEADQKQVILRCDVPSTPLSLLADPQRMEQVIINVLNFALLFTAKDNVIAVSAAEDTKTQEVIVTIDDNGRGIASEHVEHLFEPFYRLDVRQPGSGLGLALAREIVMLHNGLMDVTSTLEKGTCFIIRLPLDGMGGEA